MHLQLADDEDGFAVERQKQGLVGVVAGGLLAGQIEDVLRTGGDQDVDAGSLKGLLGARHAGFEFIGRKGGLDALAHRGVWMCHSFSSQRQSQFEGSNDTPSPGTRGTSTQPSR